MKPPFWGLFYYIEKIRYIKNPSKLKKGEINNEY